MTTSRPESPQSDEITLSTISDQSSPSSAVLMRSPPSSAGEVEDMTRTSESHTLSYSTKGETLTNLPNVSR